VRRHIKVAHRPYDRPIAGTSHSDGYLRRVLRRAAADAKHAATRAGVVVSLATSLIAGYAQSILDEHADFFSGAAAAVIAAGVITVGFIAYHLCVAPARLEAEQRARYAQQVDALQSEIEDFERELGDSEAKRQALAALVQEHPRPALLAQLEKSHHLVAPSVVLQLETPAERQLRLTDELESIKRLDAETCGILRRLAPEHEVELEAVLVPTDPSDDPSLRACVQEQL
jgi:hypothetical protein